MATIGLRVNQVRVKTSQFENLLQSTLTVSFPSFAFHQYISPFSNYSLYLPISTPDQNKSVTYAFSVDRGKLRYTD